MPEKQPSAPAPAFIRRVHAGYPEQATQPDGAQPPTTTGAGLTPAQGPRIPEHQPYEVLGFSFSPAAKASARLITALAALAALAVLVALAACGGSGSDEPDKTIDPLVCLHRPQVCK